MTAERPSPQPIFLAAVMLLLPQIGTLAQTTAPMLRLSGIVHLSDAKIAVLEAPPVGSQSRGDSFVLSERQREGLLEVLEIQPKTRTVRVKLFSDGGSSVLTLTNNASHAAANVSGIVFENASLEPVLRLHSGFSQRTLLRSPSLPRLSFSLVAGAENRAAAALAIQRALNEKGVATIPDGEKFMMIVPREQAASVKPRASEIKPSGAVESEILPPGVIDFRDTGIPQVLQIYAELCQRKCDYSAPMPPTVVGSIQFHNQTSLNRAEVVYALDTLLGWAGLKMIASGENQMKPVPIQGAHH